MCLPCAVGFALFGGEAWTCVAMIKDADELLDGVREGSWVGGMRQVMVVGSLCRMGGWDTGFRNRLPFC